MKNVQNQDISTCIPLEKNIKRFKIYSGLNETTFYF